MAESLLQSNFVKFPNAAADECEYIKYLCGVQLSSSGASSGKSSSAAAAASSSSLSAEVAKARQRINESLAGASSIVGSGGVDSARVEKLEAANRKLESTVQSLSGRVAELEKKLAALATSCSSAAAAAANGEPSTVKKEVKKVEKADEEGDDDDDDVDLFGSDDEEDKEEAERVKQERLKAYEAKKSKKPAAVAKSSIVLDVKPWDDETDMAEMERLVRTVETDGLLWGASKLVPLAYGIKKLQISCVVEDDKVGTDFLEEEIGKFEEFVQSVDIAAFQKI